MARNAGAKKDKAKSSPSGNTTNEADITPTTIPPPFSKAPEALSTFLSTLSKDFVYITHLDTFPAAFKRRIFAVPVALNVIIAILLIWRLYVATPIYLALIFHMFGYTTPATVDTTAHATSTLVWMVVRRTFMFMCDFLLFRFVGPWPVTFFLQAPCNPVVWRWKVGFRDVEICIRVSRDWGRVELMEGVKAGEGSPFFATRVLPAVERAYVRSKTGYLMMGRDFDLDFEGMVKAHEIVGKEGVDILAFRKTVLVWSEEIGEWLAWQVWKLDDEGRDDDTRKRIVDLRDKLTAIGKESLFFRWIEIVQTESSTGDFTPDRQRATLKKIEAMFDEQGVSFRELIQSVGGMEGMPGMDATG